MALLPMFGRLALSMVRAAKARLECGASTPRNHLVWGSRNACGPRFLGLGALGFL